MSRQSSVVGIVVVTAVTHDGQNAYEVQAHLCPSDTVIPFRWAEMVDVLYGIINSAEGLK